MLIVSFLREYGYFSDIILLEAVICLTGYSSYGRYSIKHPLSCLDVQILIADYQSL